jgi:hypothetical protein
VQTLPSCVARDDARTTSRSSLGQGLEICYIDPELTIEQICSLPEGPSAILPFSSPTPAPPLPLAPSQPAPVGIPFPGRPAPSQPPIPDLPVPSLLKAALPSDSVLPDRPLVPDCECEEMMCIASYPEGCICQYAIKKNCYDKCGGPSPGLMNCPSISPLGGPFELDGPVKRDAIPEPQVSTVPIPVDIPVNLPVPTNPDVKDQTADCTCEESFCLQSWPESCTCANANKTRCWEKCGGPKPQLQVGIVFIISTRYDIAICRMIVFNICSGSWMNQLTKQSCLAPEALPKLPTTPPTEPRTYQVCGGNRLGANSCPKGYICMNDPFRKGCGLECDATGICVKNKLCGGFAGFRCPDSRQVCVDAPSDGCDPQNGGADCDGVCVWPPELRTV